MGAAIQGWASALYGACEELSGVGRSSQVLRPGERLDLDDGVSVSAAAPVAWIRIRRGSGRLGAGDVLEAPGAGPPGDGSQPVFPLVSPAVLVAVGACEVEDIDLTDAAGDCVVAGLTMLAQNLRPAEAAFVRSARAQADAGVHERAAQEGRSLDDAVHRLAGVLAPDGDAAGVGAPDRRGGPLQFALDTVGRAIGVTFPDVRGLPADSLQAAQAAAAAAGTRARIVELSPRWWRETAAPLIVVQGPQGRPVAVLPRSARRWEWVDPASGARRRADRTFAATLAPDAVTFLRPLPAGKVGLREVIRLLYTGVRRSLWGAAAMGLLASVMSLVVPLATQIVYGDVFPSGERSLLFAVTALLAGAGIASIVLSFTRSIAGLRIGGTIESVLLPATWDRLLRLPLSFFRRFSVGDLQARIAGISAARTAIEHGLTVVMGVVFASLTFVVMFVYSPLLAAVALVGCLLFIGALVPFSVVRMRRVRLALELKGSLTGTEFQLIQAVAQMRVAGAERRAVDLWARAAASELAAEWRVARVAVVQTAVAVAVPSLLVAVIYAITGTQLIDTLDPGSFMGFMAALGLFAGSFTKLYDELDPLLRIGPLYRRIEPLLSEPVEDGPGAIDPGSLDGAVALDHVSFCYDPDGPTILDDVSLEVRPGEFVAVTGPSGAGKSTLLRMLLGFETPDSGRVLYGERDLAGLRKDSVRRQIGAVLQGATVPAGTILAAIRGGQDLPESAVWDAVEAAGIAHDIRALPMQLQTMIAPGRSVFSTGQLQRLCIARAIASTPRIVLLDEATSALDNATQAAVAAALDRIQATRIVVAHRLSTIRHADRIYVLDHGRVVQTGTYESLMSAPGMFRDLVSRQVLDEQSVMT